MFNPDVAGFCDSYLTMFLADGLLQWRFVTMQAERHNDDLFPVCCLMGIFAGFFGYLFFAPLLLPTVLSALVGVFIGMLICADKPERDDAPQPIRHVVR